VKVAFRVDANLKMGSGHLMRCLTLAQLLKAQGAGVFFICRAIPDCFLQIILNKGFDVKSLAGWDNQIQSHLKHGDWLGSSQVNDAKQSIDLLSKDRVDCLVVDHYGIDITWEVMVSPFVDRLLVIDDLADREHDCHYLLDQNYYLNADVRYEGKLPVYCDQLLGVKYALLRPEFLLKRAQICKFRRNVQKVLVSFGGVDDENYTEFAVKALSTIKMRGVKVDVVVGNAYPYYKKLRQLCISLGFSCHRQIDNIAEFMYEADLAIAAGGSSTWERCCLGLPSIVISVANNQDELVANAAVEGLVYKVDKHGLSIEKLSIHIQLLIENHSIRELFYNNGLSLLKGDGAKRVCDILTSHKLLVRKATAVDSPSILKWRNHPSIRSKSKSNNYIHLVEHRAWFLRVLNAKDQELLIIEDSVTKLAVVRFDLKNETSEISIYLVPGEEGKGLGRLVLNCAERWLRTEYPRVKSILAVVINNNYPSHMLFLNSGYKRNETYYSKNLA